MSDLPVGAGLSSSAAIELASTALAGRADAEDPPRDTLVRIGRHAENRFVGVPCGIRDLQGRFPAPWQEISMFVDLRCLAGRSAAAAAERRNISGFSTPTRSTRWSTKPLRPAPSRMHGSRARARRRIAGGYHAGETRFEKVVRASGPRCEPSAELEAHITFLKRATHVVEELGRVEAAVAALRAGDLDGVGRLLTASHRSSQRLFENSTRELDFLVDALTTLPHVFGARLTGGGFGDDGDLDRPGIRPKVQASIILPRNAQKKLYPARRPTSCLRPHCPTARS